MAILAWHQTPLATNRPSPAMIHMGRTLRDMTSFQVKQSRANWDDVRQWKEAGRMEEKNKYDQRARSKPLEPLRVGQKVFAWHTEKWERGVINEANNETRSYKIRLLSGTTISRNRILLRPDNTQHSEFRPLAKIQHPVQPFLQKPSRPILLQQLRRPDIPAPAPRPQPPSSRPDESLRVQPSSIPRGPEDPYRTRTGRTVKRPAFLSDFIT